MLWAPHQQLLDPLSGKVLGSALWSTLFAALPVVVLFWLLVPRRWPAPRAGAAAAVTALVVAVLVYGMKPGPAVMAFVNGAGFGLLPVGWTIFNAMLLYNITVETGQFAILRRSVASLSADARIQAILIGFSFGAFLEGAAGGGTPVAICGAIMVGLGFHPFLAAVLCLIANTSPVAYGGLGTPLIVLYGVTDLPAETLSVMAGHQLPLRQGRVRQPPPDRGGSAGSRCGAGSGAARRQPTDSARHRPHRHYPDDDPGSRHWLLVWHSSCPSAIAGWHRIDQRNCGRCHADVRDGH